MNTTHRKTILLIERHDPFRESLAELLALESYQVLTAGTGGMGLKLARQYLPELIICARDLLDNNCWNILQELRKTESTRTTPFIFLSSKPAGDQHQLMQRQQRVFTLIKPFRTEQLLYLIRKCLNIEHPYLFPKGGHLPMAPPADDSPSSTGHFSW